MLVQKLQSFVFYTSKIRCLVTISELSVFTQNCSAKVLYVNRAGVLCSRSGLSCGGRSWAALITYRLVKRCRLWQLNPVLVVITFIICRRLSTVMSTLSSASKKTWLKIHLVFKYISFADWFSLAVRFIIAWSEKLNSQ